MFSSVNPITKERRVDEQINLENPRKLIMGNLTDIEKIKCIQYILFIFIQYTTLMIWLYAFYCTFGDIFHFNYICNYSQIKK